MLERVGKYKIKHELGRGTSAAVYLGYDEFADAEVALKVYDTDRPSSDPRGFKGMFMSEAALAGKLNHPHIVSIYDAVVDEEHAYVAMEYVRGGNLTRYTHGDRLLPVADVIEMAFKCCGALDYAYRHGIVHRDIKPGNILVARGTEVKVADFGAAFLRNVDATQRVRVGSPSYIAPEQIRDDPLTHQSDMFSLGVLLYEMLVGSRPFTGKTTAQVLERVVLENPVPPVALRPELPEGLSTLVMRMLEKYPEDRYPDWAELALHLAQLGGLSVFDQAIRDSEKFLALRPSRLLAALEDAELWELVRIGRWRRVPSQTVLVREGDVGDSLFLLASGEAKVIAHGRLLNVLRAGDCFGEMGYAQEGRVNRLATVETTAEALVAELPRTYIEALNAPCQLKLSRALLRALAERLALANARLSAPPSGHQN